MRYRRRTLAYAAPGEEPISAINTTPMIDVMLVLLIMFILTLPLTTHAVKMDLPTDGGSQDQPPHELALDGASRLTWDGVPIAEAELPARLAAFRAGSPDNFLQFRADALTRYEDFDRILASVKRSGIVRLGFIGNERFAQAY